MSVIHADFERRQVVPGPVPPLSSRLDVASELVADLGGQLILGNFPGMAAKLVSPLESIQTGASLIAQLTGENADITGLSSGDYFMKPVIGQAETYEAGRYGVYDFSISLRSIAKDRDLSEAAQIMYGAYGIGRLLLPKFIETRLSAQLDLNQLTRRYQAIHVHSTLEDAKRAVYGRAAATLALFGINKILDKPSKGRIIAAVTSGYFPKDNQKVAKDFQQHLGTEAVARMVGLTVS